jgi:hypothetical protein
MFFYSIISLSFLLPLLFFSKYPIETIVMSFLTHIIVFLLIVYLYVANIKWIIHLFAPIDKLQIMSPDEETKNDAQLFWEEMLMSDNENYNEDGEDSEDGEKREEKITKDAFLALFQKKDIEKEDKEDKEDKEEENKNMHTFEIPHNKTLYGYLVDACLFYPMVFTFTTTFYLLISLSFRESIKNTIYN